MSKAPTIGWSVFAKKNARAEAGNSYTTLEDHVVEQLVKDCWDNAAPGHGETDLTRKVVVPVPTPVVKKNFFLPPRAKLVKGMPIFAEVFQRQEHEEPFVETFTTPEVAGAFNALMITPADYADIVCYSAEALEENGEKRSTDRDWEIVTILCRLDPKREPMKPLAMARNFLEKEGGTKSEYTALEFAEAIWHKSTQSGIRVRQK